MLSPVSSFQPSPIVSFTQKPSSENENDHTANLEKKESKEITPSEASTLTQKSVEALSQHDQAIVQQLKSRDLEVKAHEQAHLSVAGSFATGGASFTYTTGPNGVRYATGGEVGIDSSKIEGNPAATIRKADAIRRAALAPASPSSQDQLVARNATVMAEEARADLIQLTQEEQKNAKETEGTKEAKEIAKNKASKGLKENQVESNYVDGSTSISNKGSLLDLSI